MNHNRIIKVFLLIFFIFLFSFSIFIYSPIIYKSFTSLEFTWQISDLLINYEGGFVRRGLLGHIVYNLSKLLQISQIKIFATIFLLIFILQIVGLIYLLKDYKKSLFVIILILYSPVLFFQSLNDYGAYLRKESVIILILILHTILAKLCNKDIINIKTYFSFLKFTIIPFTVIGTLIHELQFFILPAHLALTYLVNRWHFNKSKSIYLWYVTPVLMFLISIQFIGTREQADLIINSLSPEFLIEKGKAGAIETLAWTSQQSFDLSKIIFNDKSSLLLYTFGYLLAVLLPMLVLVGYLYFNRAFSNYIKFYQLVSLILFVLLGPVPLFYIGWDFGRWISITVWAITCVLLSIPLSTNSINKINIRTVALQISLLGIIILFVTSFSIPTCCPNPSIFKNTYKNAFSNSLKLFQ